MPIPDIGAMGTSLVLSSVETSIETSAVALPSPTAPAESQDGGMTDQAVDSNPSGSTSDVESGWILFPSLVEQLQDITPAPPIGEIQGTVEEVLTKRDELYSDSSGKAYLMSCLDMEELTYYIKFVIAPPLDAPQQAEEFGHGFVTVQFNEYTSVILDKGFLEPEVVEVVTPDDSLSDPIVDDTPDPLTEEPPLESSLPADYIRSPISQDNPVLATLNTETASLDASKFSQLQVLKENSSNSILTTATSPLNKLGIASNRPKIIMQTTYHPISRQSELREQACQIIRDSITFNVIKQDAVIKFVSDITITNPDLYGELVDSTAIKKQRLDEAIDFIRQLDIYKQSLYDTIKDFKSSGLDYLGYSDDLNLTTGIRNMYNDISEAINHGGIYLYHFTNGIQLKGNALVATSATARIIDPAQEITPMTDALGLDSFLLDNTAIKSDDAITVHTVTDPDTSLEVPYVDDYQWNGYVLGIQPNPTFSISSSTDAGDNTIDYDPEKKTQTGFFSTRYAEHSENRHHAGYEEALVRFAGNEAAATAHLAQLLYTELLTSYAISSSPLTPAEARIKYDPTDLLKSEIGDAITKKTTNIADLDNSKKLSEILKFNTNGKSVMPFAFPGELSSSPSENLTSGIEEWVNPNIANIFEERALSFKGLDTWVSKFSSLHDLTKAKVDPYVKTGSSQIIFNEILRALKNWSEGKLNEQHPVYGLRPASDKGLSFNDPKWPIFYAPGELPVLATAEFVPAAADDDAPSTHVDICPDDTEDYPTPIDFGDFDTKGTGPGTGRDGQVGEGFDGAQPLFDAPDSESPDIPFVMSAYKAPIEIADTSAAAIESRLFETNDTNQFATEQNYFNRKTIYAFYLLSKLEIDTDPDIFWYFVYQSVQGCRPQSDQYTETFTKNILSIITGRPRDDCGFNTDDGNLVIGHALTILNTLMGEIEKNIYYDIALLANQSGISGNSPGQYDSSTAANLANNIFGENSNAEAIYRSATPGSATTVVNDETLASGYRHFQIRGMLVSIASSIAKKVLSSASQPNPITSWYITSDYADSSGAYFGTAVIDERFSSFGSLDAYVKELIGYPGIVNIDTKSDPSSIMAEISKVFLPVVENIDPSKGPTRWGIQYGIWQSSGYELETADFVTNTVVPEYAKEIVDNGSLTSYDLTDPTVAKTFTENYGIGSKYDMTDIFADEGGESATRMYDIHAHGGAGLLAEQTWLPGGGAADWSSSIASLFSFLTTTEDVVPYTWVDDAEVPSNAYEVTVPRGSMNALIKASIYQREDSRRIIEYLDKIMEKFKSIEKEVLLIQDFPYSENLFEIAKLTGIEVEEIVEYSNLRQTFLREYIASEEAPRIFSGYLPSNSTVGASFILAIEEQLDQFLIQGIKSKWCHEQRDMSDASEGKILTVGIPSGYIDNQVSKSASINYPTVSRIIRISQNTTSLHSNYQFEPVDKYYWPALFINNESFIKSFIVGEDAHKSIEYGYIDADTLKYRVGSYDTVSSILNGIITKSSLSIPGPDPADEIIKNAFNDFLIKTYMNVYAGLNVDESSFSVNKDSNVMYLDQIAIDNIDLMLAHTSSPSADSFIKDGKIIPFNEYYDSNMQNDKAKAYETYTAFVSLTQSRLFSADQMTTKTLAPNIFDRVFSFYTHMGELAIDLKDQPDSLPDTAFDHGFIDADDTELSVTSFEYENIYDQQNSIDNDLNVQIYIECNTVAATSASS